MSKTILLADDSLTIQKVVELTFSDTDFEVIATSSGNELLERLPSSGADIVICDTIMPGIDGYGVCQGIKSEPSTLHIPVILMTGTFEPFDRDRALAAGCSEIITKPFEARNLVETVKKLVSGQGVAAPAAEAHPGSVAPPEFGDVVTPPDLPTSADSLPIPDQAGSEFGTMLSHPPDAPAEVTSQPQGEELDFTSTGFAEMEAAGSEPAPVVIPEHGLEFDASMPTEPVIEEPDTTALPEMETTQPIPAVDFDEAVDPFDASAPGMFAQSEKEEVAPAVEEPPTPELDVLVETAPEPEPYEAPEPEPEVLEPTETEIFVDSKVEFNDYAADTDPVVETAPEPAVMPPFDGSVEELSESPVGQLSDADIDRIARRVVELAADRLEKIAWDVIPDMAEIVVRERVRELEDEIESGSGTAEPN